MTFAQMLTKLRRRVNEEVGDSAGGWTDPELNAEINQAYAWVQKEIFKVQPTAHLYWDTMDTELGENWYPLGATFGIRRVGYKATSSATTYTKLKRKVYEDVEDIDTGDETYYTQMGQWIGLFPAPSEAVTDGIQLLHVPIMSLDTGTDIPRIKLPLHEAILLKAKDQVLGDLDEDSQKTRQDLADLINDIPLWYELNQDEPDRFQATGLHS